MKKFIFGLISVMFVSAMAFSLSSCSKEDVEPGKDEVEPGKDEDEVTILGTWRHYTDKANGYYYQITLEEDGTLIWREIASDEDETSYDTYTYEDGYITWYTDYDIEAIWYVDKFDESTMVTHFVDQQTGTHDSGHKIIWARVK